MKYILLKRCHLSLSHSHPLTYKTQNKTEMSNLLITGATGNIEFEVIRFLTNKVQLKSRDWKTKILKT